jgi:hypothetical protein
LHDKNPLALFEKNLILLGSILIFMDQQITAVIVNRKEHKLEVSPHTGFHPDQSQPNPYPDHDHQKAFLRTEAHLLVIFFSVIVTDGY